MGASMGNIDWKQLLKKEKDRRGIKHNQLVFVGMANVAGYWWCAARALMRSRRQELQFFQVYLIDRLRYSLELGRIKKLPRKRVDWLEVGEDLTLRDLQPLLKRRQKERKEIFVVQTAVERDGVLYVNPDLTPEAYQTFANDAKQRGVRIARIDEDPMLRGEMLETSRAEGYPTIRWNFPWNDYVVVGVPDGLTDEFVYEYKTTGNKFLLSFTKPVALAQADLYGYFFGRKSKRVQIYTLEDDRTCTIDEPVDQKHALRTLEKFQSVDAGVWPHPPKAWKCKKCDYREDCEARPKGKQV